MQNRPEHSRKTDGSPSATRNITVMKKASSQRQRKSSDIAYQKSNPPASAGGFFWSN
jgi:hypothetical protein